MLNPPQVVPALPANFILASASPETKTSGDYNMYDGVIWAPERTARQYEFMSEKSFRKLQEPLFWVRLSSSVGQKPGTDEFSHEGSIVESMTQMGFTKVKKAKHKWGAYPVLSVTGLRPDGSDFFSAWVGINSRDGWAMLVDYRVPQGKGHPTAEERRIWRDLLNQTKP